MSFSINTNVTSLQAQNNLRAASEFQAKTINRVTSGLRIVNSGDDAAGLAIANGYRSDQAVLTQGISNAGDGLSTLQTIDGGMNNISLLLDRARTLATQSASGTFAGSRDVLNNEFQSVLAEIDRQSTAIGMNTGGQFAKSMSVFIGGGKDAGGVAANVIKNGSVDVDLSKSTVDTQSLGLKGFVAGYQSATDSGLYDLSSGTTSVAALKTAAGVGMTTATFDISGAGFSGTNKASITVDLANVTDTASLAAAVNNGIQAAAATSNTAFKAANIVAEIHTGTDGHQQLQFSSSSAAFQVTGTNTIANGFMGDLTGNTAGSATGAAATNGGSAVGQATDSFVSGGTQQMTSAFVSMVGTASTSDMQTLTFTGLDSTGAPKVATVNLTGGTTGLTASQAADAINTALQATDNPALKSIVAVADAAGGGITFAGSNTSQFTVTFGAQTGTSANTTGFNANNTSIRTSTASTGGGTADITNQGSAQAAVSALAAAVTVLGTAQANVGKGENTFNYAMNLAQSQTTNLAASESRIRDADLASEAANLTKAQILIQAGTAALAQANTAPQAILSLLKG